MKDYKQIEECLYKADLIRQKMKDEVSRELFDLMMDNLMSGGWLFLPKYESALLDSVKKYTSLWYITDTNVMKELSLKSSYIVFGCGEDGKHNIKCMQKAGVKISGCIDNSVYASKEKLKVDNETYNVFPAEYALNKSDELILVSSSKHKDEIFKQLVMMGVNENRIINAGRIFAEKNPQYFDLFLPEENEFFLDVGAFDGQNSLDFIEWCDDREFSGISIWEPLPQSFKKCCERLSGNKNIQLYSYAASDVSGNSYITETMNSESALNNDGIGAYIQTRRIDDFLDKHRQCTYLKMDIEGMEMAALRGAQTLIAEKKPKLAISVYHRFTDFLLIPCFLSTLVPEYDFYLRHYTDNYRETVLYASTK